MAAWKVLVQAMRPLSARKHLLGASLWVLLAFVPVHAQAAPSFACKPGQGAVENAICASPALSAADREMAALYAANQASAFGTGPSNELAAQRSALRDMQGCAHPPGKTTVAACLAGLYDLRNYALALGALLRAPDLALPVMRRVDPIFAPIAEAIALWASEPEGADWSAPARAAKRAHILALLKPTLTALLTQKEDDFARSVLADSTGDGVQFTRPDDLLRSGRHFAAFLNVIGPVLDDNFGAASRAIPCAAIVHHPSLLAATGSIYGSTLDNGVLDSDCRETLPPTPALDTLDMKLRKAWPECEGTIRFAAYRTYQVSLDAARLGFTPHDPKARLEQRAGVTAATVAAARSELAAYYGRYLGKTRQQADMMASDALIAILKTAQECD